MYLAGAIVFIISLGVGWMAFRGETSIPFYTEFPEWQLAQTRIESQGLADTVGISIQHILDAVIEFIQSFNDHQIASIVRWTSVFAILPVMMTLGSRFSSLRHQVYGELGQKKLFDRRQGTLKNFIANTMLSIAMLVSVYVILSILLLLLNLALLTLSFSMWGAVIVTALLSGLIVLGIIYWVISMNTRDLLTLALVTLFSGILSGFAIAGQDETITYAWQHAISRLGEIEITNWLFAGTLVSTVMILSVFAYHISGYVVLAAKVEGKNGNYQRRVLIFYFAALIGILAVGLVPSNSSVNWLHFAGAIGGFATMISMIVYLIHDWAEPVFSDFTRYTVYLLGVVALMTTIIFGGGKLFPEWFAAEPNWGITLTGVELVLLTVAGALLGSVDISS